MKTRKHLVSASVDEDTYKALQDLLTTKRAKYGMGFSMQELVFFATQRYLAQEKATPAVVSFAGKVE